MANYISEQQIQQRLVRLFLEDLDYDLHVDARTHAAQLGRSNQKRIVAHAWLRPALERLNDHLPTAQRDELLRRATETLTRARHQLTPLAANKEVHWLLKRGFDTTIKIDGTERAETVRYLDFENPKRNHFAVVEELTILGRAKRRPDLLVYVNGIPLVFIELKNSNVDVYNAYKVNLENYKRDIPRLFDFNAFLILSNALKTHVGSYTAEWEHFNEWKRVSNENEDFNPKEEGLSLERTIHGMCAKERLLDLLQNFIFYFSDAAKIVAKNHQYLGVNNGIASFEQRLAKEGKLGVFWHTQGSGKSFSMIFLAMKVFERYRGNYTFLVVTDRDSLDKQLFENFLRAEVISENDQAQANSRAELKTMLSEQRKRFVFTLIQKFGTERGQTYPILTERDDIIVFVDEAHRTQYNTFAENMRHALPNANYLAFTGTPLLDANETTRKWFGDYVSEYNFAQSIEDGATVPIYYENRVPQVRLSNKLLNTDFAEIVEKDNLSEVEEEKLKRQYANELEIVKRDDRLEKIAQDIVDHFPFRGYRGKGMVISVDKYTTVRMYDKVQRLWRQKIRELRDISGKEPDRGKQQALVDAFQFMRDTEMYVVISGEADEERKFKEQGLNITPHREAMRKRYGEKKLSLRDRFQRNDDPFRLVFVCAKWLTGFDSPTISTLYLDKPMQNHTLMQTIARANRVAPGKQSGMVVDYFGVFDNLEKALEKYGQDKKGKGGGGKGPVEDKSALIALLKAALAEIQKFLAANDCDMKEILDSENVFHELNHFQVWANRLSQTEELRKTYNVHQNAVSNLYRATQPDAKVAEKHRKQVEAYEYLRQIVDGNRSQLSNYDSAFTKTRELLDESISVAALEKQTFYIPEAQRVDLRNLNLDKLEKSFAARESKYLTIVDFQSFLKQEINRMLNQNVSRIDFAIRLQEIIDRYNSKDSDVDRFFEALLKYTEELRAEDIRAQSEGLTEQELEIFDLLYQKNLTKDQKRTLKLASQFLLKRLHEERDKLLVTDWHKTERQRIAVERFVKMQLYQQLYPKVFSTNEDFNIHSDQVFALLRQRAEMGVA